MRCRQTGKFGHATKESAVIRQKKLGPRKHLMNVYQCTHCQQWHLGTSNNRKSDRFQKFIDDVRRQDAEKRHLNV